MIKRFLSTVFNFRNYHIKNFSLILLVTIYAIGGLGCYLISILQDSGENLASKQIKGFVVGLGIILIVAIIDYHFVASMYILLYIFSLGLLLICRLVNSGPIYGWSHYEARRWIKIGGDPTAGIYNTGFEFQPSEITKVVMIIFLAKLFDKCFKYIKKLWVVLLAAIFTAIPTYLILTQTDLSTSIVMVMLFCAMVFISGVSLKIIVPAVAVLVPGLFFTIWYVQQDYQVLLNKYQKKRVMAALYPDQYPELVYQQDNAGVAIRSGGVIGKLLSGDTGVRGTSHVPVKESDFIFTAVAEEFGFIGSVALIVLYLVMILLIVRIARRAADYLGMMIAMGIASLWMFQVFINIGVVTSLLPNTGIPLPFMSSGLSALLINILMVGVLLNISMQPKPEFVGVSKELSDELILDF